MQRFFASLATISLTVALSLPAMAATKTYQVTGLIVKITDKLIVVQKPNDEKWEIERTADTKITGTLKVGAKITIVYHMEADSAEVK